MLNSSIPARSSSRRGKTKRSSSVRTPRRPEFGEEDRRGAQTRGIGSALRGVTCGAGKRRGGGFLHSPRRRGKSNQSGHAGQGQFGSVDGGSCGGRGKGERASPALARRVGKRHRSRSPFSPCTA